MTQTYTERYLVCYKTIISGFVMHSSCHVNTVSAMNGILGLLHSIVLYSIHFISLPSHPSVTLSQNDLFCWNLLQTNCSLTKICV